MNRTQRHIRETAKRMGGTVQVPSSDYSRRAVQDGVNAAFVTRMIPNGLRPRVNRGPKVGAASAHGRSIARAWSEIREKSEGDR